MTAPARSHPLRSLGAVVAGLVCVVVLSVATDAALRALGVFPTSSPMSGSLLLLALAYRTTYAVLGSYVAARLAPRRPMRHALFLGVVGLVLSLAGLLARADSAPLWYPVALVAIALPCAWAGGRLHRAPELPLG